jgi:nicotinamide-nucleotide amidase
MKSIIKKLIKKKIKISVAESCTGGLFASILTSVDGSSKIFDLGLVTYSNQSKIKVLKINKNIINKYGAVSPECCNAMVQNLSKISNAHLNVSITGVAGPKGGSKSKPIGLVYIGVKRGKKTLIKKNLFKSKNRITIQKTTVKKALEIIHSIT